MASTSWSLPAQMVATCAGILALAVTFLCGVWTIFYWTFFLFGVSPAVPLATVVTAVLVVVLGYAEYRQVATIERHVKAEQVNEADEPELYELVTRVAAQLDVPVPTIAISERQAPESLAVGFRPNNIHLVLSRGTLDALGEIDELEAVVAHELAHVKNRDAMVMTAASVPVVIARGLDTRLEDVDHPRAAPFALPLDFFSTLVWTTGKTMTARLSRTRERAADRAAVAVTGSPAALATALAKLDSRIAETPNRDLREVSGVSSLSILSLEPEELEKVMLGAAGEKEPSYWWLRTRLYQIKRWLFRTHPPTDERIEQLREYQQQQ